MKSKNIVVGDLEKFEIIFTAHYDTAAKRVLPIPMIMTPNNKPLYLSIQIIPVTLIALGLRRLFILMGFPSIIFGLIPIIVIEL